MAAASAAVAPVAASKALAPPADSPADAYATRTMHACYFTPAERTTTGRTAPPTG